MSNILTAVAWPYANGPRHIGHVAGFGVPSDVFSRYMRMKGHDVLMVSGTDEHGTPILVAADKENITAQQLADKNNKIIVEDLVSLGLSYDLFTRTTTSNHYKIVQEMFKKVRDNGYMVEKKIGAAISPSTGRTLPDRYIEGTCPLCGYEQARGDQCDECGKQLDPEDLINPKSKINGETPQFIETTHYFLDLPALAESLQTWLEEREKSGKWRPNVIKFSQNILDEIKPRAMSRDIDWGIPVPGWEDQPNKRLYVWFDAVIGYLSASIEWAYRSGDKEKWRQWWNNPEALSYYFMGKDNIVFHSQIWPAELLAYNGKGQRGGQPGQLGELNLPTEVVASEFLTMEGKQFSSSRGIVIYVRDILSRYQPDALRYFISIAGPENQDSDFTWKEFVRRNNDELVSGWGNLVNRTLTMIAKNFGQIPEPCEFEDIDKNLLESIKQGFEQVGELISVHKQKLALTNIMKIVSETNKYIAETEPFKMKDQSQKGRLQTVLYVLAQAISDINLMMSPFLPHSSNKISKLLGQQEVAPMPEIKYVEDIAQEGQKPRLTTYPIITGDYTNVPEWKSTPVKIGAQINKPKPVFVKLDEKVIDEEIARMK